MKALGMRIAFRVWFGLSDATVLCSVFHFKSALTAQLSYLYWSISTKAIHISLGFKFISSAIHSLKSSPFQQIFVSKSRLEFGYDSGK